MEASGLRRRLTLLSLSAATFFIVAGGPYGLEDVVAGNEYAETLVLLLAIPVVWSLPVTLLVGSSGAHCPRPAGATCGCAERSARSGACRRPGSRWRSPSSISPSTPRCSSPISGRSSRRWRVLDLGGVMGMIALCAGWNALGIRAVGVGSGWLAALILAPFVVIVALALGSLPAGGLARASEALRAAPPAAGGPAWIAGLIACMCATTWAGTTPRVTVRRHTPTLAKLLCPSGFPRFPP